MKILKNKFHIFFFLFFASISFGQTLTVADLRKAFDYHKPTEHKQLLSKGFQLIDDSISTNQKRFTYNKPSTKERVELTFSENREGDEFLTITYLLQTESDYKKFISTLHNYHFKYSKRNKRYQLPSSSYSGENIYLMGLKRVDGKQYYTLKYDSYIDKALSGPRPNSQNQIPLPPKSDSVKAK